MSNHHLRNKELDVYKRQLVENAIYYGVDKMLTPCSISVTVQEQENEIRIQVSDTGPGMTCLLYTSRCV